MTTAFDIVRDCARQHPLSVAASLIIALPGTYFLIAATLETTGIADCEPTTAYSPISGVTSALSQHSLRDPLRFSEYLPNFGKSNHQY